MELFKEVVFFSRGRRDYEYDRDDRDGPSFHRGHSRSPMSTRKRHQGDRVGVMVLCICCLVNMPITKLTVLSSSSCSSSMSTWKFHWWGGVGVAFLFNVCHEVRNLWVWCFCVQLLSRCPSSLSTAVTDQTQTDAGLHSFSVCTEAVKGEAPWPL